jgi:hypothetical protein
MWRHRRQSLARGPFLTLDSCARGLPAPRRRPVKAIILAATVVAFAAGPAFAEGNGGTIFGYDRWQAANGNPTIPSTQWFSLTPDQRKAMQHKMQQDQAQQIWHPQTGNPTGVAQSGARPSGS